MPREEYKKPEYNILEYTCPHCNKLVLHESISCEISTYAKVDSSKDIFLHNKDIYNYQDKYIWDGKDPLLNLKKPLIKNHIEKSFDSLFNSRIVGILFDIRICSNCGGRTYWEVIKKIPVDSNPEDMNAYSNFDEEIIQIYPQNSSIDFEPDVNMSNEETSLFNEAKDIFDRSPKSSAALLRCVLESVLRRKFEKHSKSMLGVILSDDDVKEELGENILSICEACKIIGNQSAHSSLLIYKDENINDVKILFELVNLVVGKLISTPLNESKLLDNALNIIKKSK